MTTTRELVLLIMLTGLCGCRGSEDSSKDAETVGSASTNKMQDQSTTASRDWSDGDKIPSGKPGVPDIRILKVHKNGQGAVCGSGKTATLAYKAMLANGSVIDPGTRPFSFKVGARGAIEGWDIVVARMRAGDSFTILLPQQLAYGPSKGDLKFDMELLSFH